MDPGVGSSQLVGRRQPYLRCPDLQLGPMQWPTPAELQAVAVQCDPQRKVHPSHVSRMSSSPCSMGARSATLLSLEPKAESILVKISVKTGQLLQAYKS